MGQDSLMQTLTHSSIDSPRMRRAGRDLLSLALMDARNHSLYLLSLFEQSLASENLEVPLLAELNPPLWELGHIGWFQEAWVGRNLTRHLGRRSDGTAPRLASIEAHADRWWDSSLVAHDTRWSLDLPDLLQTKAYLLTTLESALDLLEKAPDTDDALYFYRLALFHEDMHAEALIRMAQTLNIPLDINRPAAGVVREPLLVPATRWSVGLDDGDGFTFDNERPVHEVSVPEFEMDAQAVTWAQFVEFVDDGGYDRPELWHPRGWRFVQAGERRAPRYVEQIGVASGAVMQTCFGARHRMMGTQPVMHVSWWEADAWCRWAGRRLPAEIEWEVAAHTAAGRGFRWGEVWEWMGTSFRGYPGFEADPYRDYSEPWFETHKVLRGASFATRARMKHPKYRNYALPARDDLFAGFRSCSI
jgi:iron(II)-dependent oxidoreductase